MYVAAKSLGSLGSLCLRGVALTATLALCVAPLAAAETDRLAGRHSERASKSSIQSFNWLGPDKKPLPFKTDEQIIDFLASAKVVKSKVLSSGSTKPLKVLLEKDGVRAHAVFRSVDVSNGGGRQQFRDSYLFEVAAYETARLLDLNNIPPVVRRTVNNREGSLQLWIENARSETDRIARGEIHAAASKLVYQKHSMRVFDQLIYNFDRNTGNVLVDDRGKLWMIDHTRSFKPRMELPEKAKVAFVDRDLWKQLKSLDLKTLQSRLRPHLSPLQIGALMKRHQKLVDHFEALIEENGAEAVLFDAV